MFNNELVCSQEHKFATFIMLSAAILIMWARPVVYLT